MKFALLSLASLSILPLARADFNSDVPGQAVVCRSAAEHITVILSKDRTSLTKVVRGSSPERYPLRKKTETDGDTYVRYIARNGLISLWLNDQGDVLDESEAGGDQIPVKCD